MLITVLTAAAAGVSALAAWGSWPRSRPWLPWLTGLVGAVSLVVTCFPPTGADDGLAGLLGTVEALAVIALIVPTTRFAPVAGAVPAVVAAHLAVTVWPLRAAASRFGGTPVGACAFWSLVAATAVVGSCYLRMLDVRRTRSVADGRRRQRLDLARDLHDFVAHDVSEMVAQAQAARFLGDRDPALALTALARIEEAGLQALASMDRTVHMLHAEDASPADLRSGAAPGVDDLPDLVARFDASSPGRIRLTLDPAVAERIARETSTTAYRVVVEALTNVRRHAPEADVEVCLAADAAEVTVTVSNSISGVSPRRSRRGGLGLPGLADRVTSLDGRFSAGPRETGGWLVTAVLPLDLRS
ncbi:sensor histidine kinase [Catenulispora subtropica]|uniref:histidine kinase n=1 Tax=Catenulispora subtropica TaxID=450798 RepID=A0ABN2QUK0_9ACTN